MRFLRTRARFLARGAARLLLRYAPSEAQRLFALTIIIGIVCGLAAVAFHLAIRALENLAINRAYTASAWPVWVIASPALGGLLAGVLLQYLAPNARGSGVPQVKLAFAAPNGRIRLRDAAAKFAISAIQLGSGASLGREGPTVQICAGIAGSLGRVFRIAPDKIHQLLPVGVAAGIAAAFNAPIAAVTFTIEEVVGKLDQTILSGIVVAAAFAAVIERSVLGEHPFFAVPQTHGLDDPYSLPFYALLGVAAAVVSITFTDALIKTRAHFLDSSRLPPWLRPALGAAIAGMLGVAVFGAFGTRGMTGGGYDTLGRALSGDLSGRVLIVLCAMKIVATVFSYSSGGAGGIFAPSLFIGGMLGGAIAHLDMAILHHSLETKAAFALVGMGAVFAGTIRAPITSVLIIFEMTGNYALILPLMIANMTSYVLARHWRHDPIYEALIKQDRLRSTGQTPASKV
jgi:CIC family chloride channel protein